MKNNKSIIGILFIIVMVAVFSYYLGSIITYKKLDKSLTNHKVNYQTFYATITDIKDTGLTIDDTLISVKGLEINDINFRGNFEFVITEATGIEWRYTKLDKNELEIGDNISIIFTGDIEEKNPARLTGVLKIQLLDDKK